MPRRIQFSLRALTLTIRPQFTLRALLVAMLVVAVVAWAAAITKRAADFRSRAMEADALATQDRRIAESIADVQTDGRPSELHRRLRLRRVVYYTRLKEKYELAARRPWMAVEPDGEPPGFDEITEPQ